MLTLSFINCDAHISIVATLPPSFPSSPHTILAAIARLLKRYPILTCGIEGPATNTPAFKTRPLEPGDIINEVPVAHGIGPEITDSLYLGLKTVESIDLTAGPLWRVTLLETPASGDTTSSEVQTRIVLGVAHVLSDGVGAASLMAELLDLIRDPQTNPDTSVLAKPTPTLESTVDIRPSFLQILKTIYKYVILPKLRCLLKSRLRLLPIFPIAATFPDCYKEPTLLRVASFPHTTLIELKRTGKAHGVNTLHPTLHGCLVAALVLATPTDSPPSSFDVLTSVSLRVPEIHPPSTGNYHSTFRSYNSGLSPSSPFWAVCRDFAARLNADPSRAEAKGLMGFLRWRPDHDENDWRGYLEKRRDSVPPERESLIHSNVGVVKAPAGVQVAWAQTAAASGACLTITVCSTPDGPLSVALSVLDKSLPVEIVDAFWTAFRDLDLQRRDSGVWVPDKT
ncbi:hypothetical protein RQP46_000047 [Phenoliferia psychrophenolica]